MKYIFFDSFCATGNKTIPSKNIDYSPESVKSMLSSVNVKNAFVCPNPSIESGSLKYNGTVFEQFEDDGFFIPGFNLVLNPGESLDGPSYFEKFIKKHAPGIIYIFNNLYAYSLSLENLSDYLDTANAYGIPLRLSALSLEQGVLCSIANEYKNTPIIVGNTGYSLNINIPLVMKNHDNIYIDTSFTPTGGLEYIADKFGSHRMVFASSAPESSPAAPAGRIIMSALKDEDKENIAYKNLMRISGKEIRYEL